MLVQRAMEWRLDKQGVYHINELIDMSNAFGSIDREMTVTAAKKLHEEEDHTLIEERVRNGVVLIEGFDAAGAFMCEEGGLMGRDETSSLFLEVLQAPVGGNGCDRRRSGTSPCG